MLLMTVLTFASACPIGKQQQITHDVDFFESLMKIKLKKSNLSHKKMISLSNFLSDLSSLFPSSIDHAYSERSFFMYLNLKCTARDLEC